MPFLRFSRDKRGYEHTSLVQATNRRGKPVRPRILYWYRTPPGIGLGRPPFDDEVRKSLEVQNPGILFDWPTILSTPFPSQEPELWRERRRAERAAKQLARREEEREEGSAAEASAGLSGDAVAALETPAVTTDQEAEAQEGTSVPEGGSPGPAAADGQARKRRRRGSRRRGTPPSFEPGAHPAAEPTAAPAVAPELSEPPDSPSEDHE